MKRSIVLIFAICSITAIITIPYVLHVLHNQKNPDLIITSFGQLENGYAGRDVVFEMNLSNHGGVTAKNCKATLFDNIEGSQPIPSPFFDVMPNSNNTSVTIKSGIYHHIGIYHIKTDLDCMNAEPQSISYSLEIAQ